MTLLALRPRLRLGQAGYGVLFGIGLDLGIGLEMGLDHGWEWMDSMGMGAASDFCLRHD